MTLDERMSEDWNSDNFGGQWNVNTSSDEGITQFSSITDTDGNNPPIESLEPNKIYYFLMTGDNDPTPINVAFRTINANNDDVVDEFNIGFDVTQVDNGGNNSPNNWGGSVETDTNKVPEVLFGYYTSPGPNEQQLMYARIHTPTISTDESIGTYFTFSIVKPTSEFSSSEPIPITTSTGTGTGTGTGQLTLDDRLSEDGNSGNFGGQWNVVTSSGNTEVLSITDTDGNNPSIESLEPNKIYYFLMNGNTDPDSIHVTFSTANGAKSWTIGSDNNNNGINNTPDTWVFSQGDDTKQMPEVLFDYYAPSTDGELKYARIHTPTIFTGEYIGSYFTFSINNGTTSSASSPTIPIITVPYGDTVSNIISKFDTNPSMWVVKQTTTTDNGVDDINISNMDTEKQLEVLQGGSINHFMFESALSDDDKIKMKIVGIDDNSGEYEQYFIFDQSDRIAGNTYQADWDPVGQTYTGPEFIYNFFVKKKKESIQGQDTYTYDLEPARLYVRFVANSSNKGNANRADPTYLLFEIYNSNNALKATYTYPSNSDSSLSLYPLINSIKTQGISSQEGTVYGVSSQDKVVDVSKTASEQIANAISGGKITEDNTTTTSINGSDIITTTTTDDNGDTVWNIKIPSDENHTILYTSISENFQATSKIRLEAVRLLEKLIETSDELFDGSVIRDTVIELYKMIYTDMVKLPGATGEYEMFIDKTKFNYDETDPTILTSINNPHDTVGGVNTIASTVTRLTKNVEAGLTNLIYLISVAKNILLPYIVKNAIKDNAGQYPKDSNDEYVIKSGGDDYYNVFGIKLILGVLFVNDPVVKNIGKVALSGASGVQKKAAAGNIGAGLMCIFFHIIVNSGDSDEPITLSYNNEDDSDRLFGDLGNDDGTDLIVSKTIINQVITNLRKQIYYKSADGSIDIDKIGDSTGVAINDFQYLYDKTRLKADPTAFNLSAIPISISTNITAYKLHMNNPENNNNIFNMIKQLAEEDNLPKAIILPGTIIILTDDNGKKFPLMVIGYGSFIGRALTDPTTPSVYTSYAVAQTESSATTSENLATRVDAANGAICFPAGTPVVTDQGIIDINKIRSDIHTIRKKKIVAITTSVPLQKNIVSIRDNALGKNVPCQTTQISMNHKILYKGNMVRARDLVGLCEGVRFIPYNKNPLYNVLLEEPGKMLINNLICETLSPANIMAKIANIKSASMRRILHRELSQIIGDNDIVSYKKMYDSLK